MRITGLLTEDFTLNDTRYRFRSKTPVGVRRKQIKPNRIDFCRSRVPESCAKFHFDKKNIEKPKGTVQ
jgi:hypothetical protein